MGGRCYKCGYDRCPNAMEFHHVDPEEKDFAISTRLSWEAVTKELARCVLLCANCHREVHAGWHPELLVPEDADRTYDPSDGPSEE